MATGLTIYLSENPKWKVLFLGYSRHQTKLIDALIAEQCEVHQTADLFEDTDYDLIISFGYRHIIKKELLTRFICPAINLHISFLPYNKGAHPNFWSFYEGTPSGVSIHLIDEGVDTGAILFQRLVKFDREKTFRETHDRLKSEIETLFMQNIRTILTRKWTSKQQNQEGTCHYLSELPKEFGGWDTNISCEIRRLHLILEKG